MSTEVLIDVFKQEISRLMKVITGMDKRIKDIEAMLKNVISEKTPKEKSMASKSQAVLQSYPQAQNEKKGRQSFPILDKKEEIIKILNRNSDIVTLHFMNNYKKIAIITFVQEDTILTVKQRLQAELSQGNMQPQIGNIVLSLERPLVCYLYF